MALIDVPELWLPRPGVISSFALQAVTLDAQNEKVAWILRANKTASIKAFKLRLGTFAATRNFTFSVQTVDATSGVPTGTLWATNTSVTVSLGSGNNNEWYTTPDLTANASVTSGTDVFAVVMNYDDSATDLTTVNYGSFGFQVREVAFPYTATFSSGAWSKLDKSPNIVIVYSDGSIQEMPGVSVFKTMTSLNFNSGSTINRRSMRFRTPVQMRASGFSINHNCVGDCNVLLRQDDDTAISGTTISIDKDIRNLTVGAPYQADFPTKPTIAADTFYRLCVEPTTTANITWYYVEADSQAMLDVYEAGSDVHESVWDTSLNPDQWVNNLNIRPAMAIRFDQIEQGAGGGSTFVSSPRRVR
jgi:hypothetical protein